jgi:uncharacterized membrane protein
MWGFVTPPGRRWLDRVELPPHSRGYFHEMLGRWLNDPVTLLCLCLGLALGTSLLLRSIRAAGVHLEQKGNPAGDPALIFALILAMTGMLLLFSSELSYLQDSFGTRMNTVFKLHYQAWLLLALAAAFGCSCALQAGKAGQALASVGFLALMAGMAYPGAALPSRIRGTRAASGTFDGIAHWSNDELAAVRWIRSNVPKSATVVEGPGTSYNPETSRVSAATGRCTLLGWPGHEMQWRGDAYPEMAGTRAETLEIIYSSATGAELLAMLRSSKVDLLYVGPIERMQYKITPDRERQFDDVMRTVFQSGAVRIYRPRF